MHKDCLKVYAVMKRYFGLIRNSRTYKALWSVINHQSRELVGPVISSFTTNSINSDHKEIHKPAADTEHTHANRTILEWTEIVKRKNNSQKEGFWLSATWSLLFEVLRSVGNRVRTVVKTTKKIQNRMKIYPVKEAILLLTVA